MIFPPMQIVFFVFSGVVVFGVVMIWLPFRAGRRPLAIHDQISAYAVIGTISWTSVKMEGLALWVPGVAGLLCGLAACVVVDMLCRRFYDWIQLSVGLVYVGTFVAILASSIAGIYLGHWVISA